MTKNVLNTDLTGKVCVVTGAGGAICGMFAEKLAAAVASSFLAFVFYPVFCTL